MEAMAAEAESEVKDGRSPPLRGDMQGMSSLSSLSASAQLPPRDQCLRPAPQVRSDPGEGCRPSGGAGGEA